MIPRHKKQKIYCTSFIQWLDWEEFSMFQHPKSHLCNMSKEDFQKVAGKQWWHDDGLIVCLLLFFNQCKWVSYFFFCLWKKIKKSSHKENENTCYPRIINPLLEYEYSKKSWFFKIMHILLKFACFQKSRRSKFQ